MKSLIILLFLFGGLDSIAQSYISTVKDTSMVMILRQYVQRHQQTAYLPKVNKANTILTISMYGHDVRKYKYYVSATQRQDELVRQIPLAIFQIDGIWVIYHNPNPDELTPITLSYPKGYTDFIKERVTSLLEPIPPFKEVRTTRFEHTPNAYEMKTIVDPRPLERFQNWVVECEKGKAPVAKIAL